MAGTVGIDVGGTYTDLYFSGDDGRVERVIKVPSTPKDPSIGLLDALRAAEIKPGDLDQILHGTTIATNAVIERRGARCALITTRGFRDVLELGRRDRPHMYGLTGIQRPLIPRDCRWEVDERLDYQGNVLIPLRRRQVRELAQVLKGEKVDAVVVSLLHSYANPAHEEEIRDILREVEPAWEIVISSGVHPRILRVRAHQHGGGAGLSPAAGLALREEPAGEARRLGLRPPDADHAVERRRRAGEPARRAARPSSCARVRRPA